MFLRHAGMIVALLMFLVLAGFQLSLPGLHYDEAVELVPALQLISHQPVTTFRDNGVWVGDQLLPLMTQDYIGALNTYLGVPFLLATGVNTIGVRSLALAIAVVTLWLTYQLARHLAGPWAANVSVLLLAVSPTFVFWSRQGVFVTSVTAAIGLAAALAWLRWWRTGKAGYAVGGAFLLGLGIYAKLLYLWLVFGLLVAAFAGLLIQSQGRPRRVWEQVCLRARGRPPRQSRQKHAGLALVVGCALSGTLACAPLIAYNLQTGGTFNSVASNLTISYYGTNNLAVLANLAERLGQFAAVLTGAHLWYLGGQYSNWAGAAIFLVALAAAIWLVCRQGSWRSGVLVPFVVIGGGILASCATVSALWVTHFAVLMPWPALAVGCAVAGFIHQTVPGAGAGVTPGHEDQPDPREARDFGYNARGTAAIQTRPQAGRFDPANSSRSTWDDRSARDRRGVPRWLTIPVVVLLLVAWGGDVMTDVRYHQALTTSGGLGAHSDAVYDLAEWLQMADGAADGSPAVAAMDWGIAAPVTILTRGEITPTELFGYDWESDSALNTRLARSIEHPDTVYLWRAPDEIIFDRSRQFQALYRAAGLEEDIVAAFYERSGRPVLGATRLVHAGAATNPPQQGD